MMPGDTRQRFTTALDALVEDIRKDRAILAAILCGSLSHDAVWDKSDIDLVLVTVDDKTAKTSDVALFADGLNVHTVLMPRAAFRKAADGSVQHSFLHSLLAKGRLLYTHDDSITEVCRRLQDLGARDAQVRLLQAGMHAVATLYKARKFLVTRGDLDYTALWILNAATPLAQIEILSRGLLLDREVLPQAAALQPAFFDLIYHDLLNQAKTRALVEHALETAEHFLRTRAASLFSIVLDYLRRAGDVRTATEIDDHF